MRRRKRKTAAEVEFDTSIWQFQLMPVDKMDFDEFIAVADYYSNEPTIGSQPHDCANNDEDIDLPF